MLLGLVPKGAEIIIAPKTHEAGAKVLKVQAFSYFDIENSALGDTLPELEVFQVGDQITDDKTVAYNMVTVQSQDLLEKFGSIIIYVRTTTPVEPITIDSFKPIGMPKKTSFIFTIGKEAHTDVRLILEMTKILEDRLGKYEAV